jgi:hypothetical protein
MSGDGKRRKEDVVIKYIIILAVLLVTISTVSTVVGGICMLYGVLAIGVISIIMVLWVGALVIREMEKGNG